MPGTQFIETEIKLRVADPAQAPQLLESAGFTLFKPRVFEVNIVLDTADASLRRAGQLLRLRQAGGLYTLTFKGPAQPGPYKSREEVEFQFSSFDAARLVFERLGYLPTFRYEKYRTEYSRAGEHGLATLDETPAGVFFELEGPESWIDAMALAMGYSPAGYLTQSYAAIYREHCKLSGIQPSNMVF